MQRSIAKEINAALQSIPGRPDAMGANYREQYNAAAGALAGADLDGAAPRIDRATTRRASSLTGIRWVRRRCTSWMRCSRVRSHR